MLRQQRNRSNLWYTTNLVAETRKLRSSICNVTNEIHIFISHLEKENSNLNSDLPASSISNKGQVRSFTKNTEDEAVNEAENDEDKNSVVAHEHEITPESGAAGAEDALNEDGDDEEDVEDEGLHSVESDVVGEARVSDDG